MQFANPTAVIWALLALPVIALYILKVRRRSLVVPTLLFWDELFVDDERRALRHRLRHWVSLLLQLVFLALIVASLAQPFLESHARGNRRLVLIVDNSASMNTAESGSTRLDQAKRQAQQIVTGLHAPEQAAVITAGTRPLIRAGLTEYRRTLKDTIDAITGTEGPTRISQAVALARRILAGAEHGRVLVFTDGCFAGAEELANSEDVQLVLTGSRTGNVGITQFQARRSMLDPVGYEVLIEVTNFSDEPIRCQLRLDLDDSVMDVVPLELAREGQWKKVLEQTSDQGGRLQASIDYVDECLSDNRAIALLSRRTKSSTKLWTEGNQLGDWFLERVLSTHPLVDLQVSADESMLADAARVIPKQSSNSEGPSRDQQVHVFHRGVPGQLPPGPVFVINPINSFDVCDVGPPLGYPLVDSQDEDASLMTHLNFKDLVFRGARQLRPTVDVRVLASTITKDPLYCAIDRPQGRVLVLTVDLDVVDLPLRTAFPILTANALSWLTGNSDDLNESLGTGAVASINLEDHSDDTLLLFAPNGESRKLAVHQGQATIGPLEHCGIWTIRSESTTRLDSQPDETEDSPPILEIACNLTNPEESDLRPPAKLTQQTSSESSVVPVAIRPIWFYLLATAVLLTTIEWHSYQRRWIA